ncbi:MAG TPA: glycogen debranching N-terminal domain-containing protein [Ideonella sp.]|jgi:glycogen debranching enzyme|nr:glycogen debranching N-terminal domain-containing protein [Ideonella sp.]
MDARVQIGDQWYVAATAARHENPPQVLKHGDTFALFDRLGDIHPGDQGLYHLDTRFLSYLELTLDDWRPLFLGSSVKDANSLFIAEQMNPDLMQGKNLRVRQGTVHVFRAKLLWQGACYEHVRLTNHAAEDAQVRIAIRFAADFVDLFEVRGTSRRQAGELLPCSVGEDEVVLRYRGLDGLDRSTRLRFVPQPDQLNEGMAVFEMSLAAGEERHLYCTVSCETGDRPAGEPIYYEAALRRCQAARSQASESRCAIETSNPMFNRWLERSASDLAMLTTALPSGPYPFAGVPWYSTTFGRDGILTAMECLWMDPTLAAGVLRFLADNQALEEDARNDAEPGKILHEARDSEMAHTGEIPFRRYYGSVDSTPLFVALAGAYWRRTGDIELIRTLWPALQRALQWMDRYGDIDGDGFIEYARRSSDGLVQQGWKDSHDSVFHSDGELAPAPIALCEVQGYAFQAKRAGAELAREMGDATLAERLHDEANRLRERFDAAFWDEEMGCYVLALDADKRPCRVAASNCGHTLWSGIAAEQHAQRMVDVLLTEPFFSGWGIRTIAFGQPRYNPMSYHNGSIWPHDNALIAAGMARYGHTQGAITMLTSLFEACQHFEHYRLPELFCGFVRRPGEGPARYPVACSPQAWAAAAAFSLLQSCLGLDVHAATGRLTLRSPRLPACLDWVAIRGLGTPGRSADLLLERYERNVGVNVLRKDPEVQVSAVL